MTTTLVQPLYRTSIGKKVMMAASGVILVLFVLFHMLGNLKAFLGPAPFNRYAEFLRTMGEPVMPRTWLLWIVRFIVASAFVVHIAGAVQTSLQSRAARKIRYAHPGVVQADYAARTMRWGGVAIGLFVVFHLAHYTWGWIHPGYTFIRGDVYHNVAAGFNVWWITAIYLAALVALGLHIYHGAWSIFQTFGTNNKTWDRLVRGGATTVAAVIVAGFASVPIAVLAGLVR